jgi:hypothetical protein
MKCNATNLRFAIRLNAQAAQSGGHVLSAVRSIAGFFFATQTHLGSALRLKRLLFLNFLSRRMKTDLPELNIPSHCEVGRGTPSRHGNAPSPALAYCPYGENFSPGQTGLGIVPYGQIRVLFLNLQS